MEGESRCTCSLEANNTLVLEIGETFEAAVFYRLETQIIFPPETMDTSLTVYTMYYGANRIVDSFTSGFFSASSYNWQSLKITYGWGFTPKSSAFQLSILYRNANSGSSVYNAITFTFQSEKTLPSSVIGKLKVNLGTGVHVLTNSIQYSLPSSGTITCTTEDDTYIYVICNNVGRFHAATSYWISMRISFDYDASNSGLHTKFGTLLYESPYYKTSLYTELRNQSYLQITNNEFKRSSVLNTQSEVHTRPDADSLATTKLFGVHYDADLAAQTLEFTLNLIQTNFGNTDNTGIDIYTSKILQTHSSHTGSTSMCYHASGLGHTPSICTAQNVNINSETESFNLRLGYTPLLLLFQVFCYYFCRQSTESWANSYLFGFKNILVTKHASLYASQDLFDFYVGCVSDNLDATSMSLSYTTKFFFNAYTINKGSIFSSASQGIFITHFWASLDASITGELFPLYIRIFGSLSASGTAISMNKLYVFFDSVLPFPKKNNETYVSCTNNMGSDCIYSQGKYDANTESYSIFNRIEITSTMSQNLNLLIPCYSMKGYKTVNVAIGVMSGSTDTINYAANFKLTGSQEASSVVKINKVYGQLIGSSHLHLYKKDKKCGEISNATYLMYLTDDQSTGIMSQNSGSNQGAGLAYTANENYYSHSNFSITSSYITTDWFAQCMKFDYYYKSNDQQKYGIWCPLYSAISSNTTESKYLFNNFKYFSRDGINMPSVYSTLSTSSGLLVFVQEDDREQMMQSNKIYLPNNSMTVDFECSYRNLKAGFIFSTTNPIPPKSKIIISTYNSSDCFYFYLNSQQTCKLVYNGQNSSINETTIPHTCSQRYTRNKIYLTLELQTTTETYKVFPEGNYTIYLQGIDINDNPVIAQLYTIETQTELGAPIDKSDPGTIYYNQQSNSTFQLTIDQIHMDANISGARGNFSLFFHIEAREIWNYEYLEFDLSVLSGDNYEGQNFLCQVKNIDDSISYEWKSCELTSILNSIKLTPSSDITQKSQKFKLELTNIHYPSLISSQYTISASLIDSVTSSVISTISGVRITELNQLNQQQQLTFPQLVIQKQYNTLGYSPVFLFNFTTQGIEIQKKSVIYITFPAYYSPGLSSTTNWKEFTSLLDNYYILSCSISHSHTLRIYNFPVTISSQFPFSIKISGIQQPFHGITQYRPFSFRIIQDKEKELNGNNIEIGDISEDVMDESSYQRVEVMNITFQTNVILLKNMMTVSFRIADDTLLIMRNSTTGEQISREIVMDLPASFIYYKPVANNSEFYQINENIPDIDKFQNNLSIALGLSDTSNVITLQNYQNFFTTDQCQPTFSFAGNRYIFNLCHTLFQNRIYQISIPVVKNPQYELCHMGNFFFGISSEDRRSFSYISTEQSINIKESPIVKSTNTLYWKWQINNKTGIRDLEDYEVVKLYRGSYTNQLFLMLEGEQRVQKNVYFDLISYYSYIADIQMNPQIPMLEMGLNKTGIRIGCSKESFTGHYQFFFRALFIQDEIFDFPYFDEPPPLDIEILDNKMPVNITSLNTSIQILVGGISLPLKLSSSTFLPYTSTKILASYPIYPDIGADFAENAYFDFSVANPEPFLLLRCYEQFNYLLSETQLSFTLSEDDQKYYEIINENKKGTINVSLINENQDNNPPLLNYTIEVEDEISTKAFVKITTNQSVYLFWSLSYNNYASTNKQYLQQDFGSQGSYLINNNSKYEEQIGRWYFNYNNSLSLNQTQLFTLDNLRANKTYYLRMVGKNLLGVESLPFNLYFITPENQGDWIQRVKVTFDRNISRFEIQSVACAFCAWFSLPWYSVRSLENITCDLSNHTYNFVSTALPQDYIDNSLFISATTNNNTLINYLSNTGYFYIFPLDNQQNSYDIYQSIHFYTSDRFNNNTGYLTEKFNMLLRNFSFVISDVKFEGNLPGKQEIIPQLIGQESFVVRSNSTWVQISNISSLLPNYSGILLGICSKLGPALDDYRAPKSSSYPTYSQISQKKTSSNQEVPLGHFGFGIYYENNTGAIEFYNLEEFTKYQVFYTVGDEDPSSFFREGERVWYMMVETKEAWVQRFQMWSLIGLVVLSAYFI